MKSLSTHINESIVNESISDSEDLTKIKAKYDELYFQDLYKAVEKQISNEFKTFEIYKSKKQKFVATSTVPYDYPVLIEFKDSSTNRIFKICTADAGRKIAIITFIEGNKIHNLAQSVTIAQIISKIKEFIQENN